MVLPHIVGVPLLFDLFIVHGSEGVITLAAYSADILPTFVDRIHVFGVFYAGNDFLRTRSPGWNCRVLPLLL